MKTLLRIILIAGLLYILYKLGQYDFMISYAEGYNDNNYYGGKKHSAWMLRYSEDLNPWGAFNTALDLTLFALWWAAIISTNFIK